MSDDKKYIRVSLGQQKLCLYSGDTLLDEYKVSSAANGAGERIDSECTPRGLHKVHEKIGNGCIPGTVFVAREPTGEIYSQALESAYPSRDWILTRILRLCGEEEGRNRGGDVDTLQRLIYIHGSPENVELGVPGSHGCIRMNNNDVISLFDRVEVGTRVYIED